MSTAAHDIQLKGSICVPLDGRQRSGKACLLDPGGTEGEGKPPALGLAKGRTHGCLLFVIVASLQITCGISGLKAYFTLELTQIITQALSLTKDLST